MVVISDAYGPVTDNAGIAEMCNLDEMLEKQRMHLMQLNTTKAVTKGYAIEFAGLAYVLFSAYTYDLNYFSELKISFSLSDPYVVVGL